MAGVTKSTNPATGEALAEVPNSDLGRFEESVREARTAQKEWKRKTFSERAREIAKVKAYLAEHAEECADVIAKCNGKTRMDALATEVLPCIMACDYYAANAGSVLAPHTCRGGSILFANKSTTVQYTPVGVVGIISPWNYPFSIPFGEVVMGLMAGNAVLLKVATCTVLCGDFIARCMAAADFPPGLFQHVVGSGGKVGSLMLAGQGKGVDKVFFTGSVQVGKDLMRIAADSLTPLSLELGGKDPMIVLEDADLERAANGACWAGYQNAGQSCGGVERVYVHSSVFQQFVDILAAKTQALRHGVDVDHEVDIGCMTTRSQLETVKKQVDGAVAEGAVIVAQSQPVGDCSKGYFYPATLVTNINHDMLLMREETFGPVIPVMPFDTIEEAVDLANDSDLALTSSVWTNNAKLARRISEQIESGITTVNDHLYTHGMSETPWGGWKYSGLGRTHGEHGLREMCNAKAINTDMVPAWLAPRNIWWYPFSKKTYDGILAGVKFVAPSNVFSWLGSVATLLPFALGTMLTPWNVEGMPKRSSSARLLFLAALLLVPVAIGGAYSPRQ